MGHKFPFSVSRRGPGAFPWKEKPVVTLPERCDPPELQTHTAGPGDLPASDRCKISWSSSQAESDEGEQLFVMEIWLLCGKEGNFSYRVSCGLSSGDSTE